MWVYQQPQQPEAVHSPQPAEHENPVSPENVHQPSAAPAQRAAKLRRGAGQATKDCVLLAAAYLLGTAAAGALQALCDSGQREALAYFLERWRALFVLSGTQDAAKLFCCEYLAAAAALTVLLFLGLSALGPLPVFLFTMLYGLGSGLLASQLFGALTPRVLAAYLVVAGVPLAAAAGCVCVFGASALQVCSKLRALSFGRRTDMLTSTGARGLVGQYALFAVSLAPVCGAATALAYAANELQIW